jgi:hypothetical protein
MATIFDYHRLAVIALNKGQRLGQGFGGCKSGLSFAGGGSIGSHWR